MSNNYNDRLEDYVDVAERLRLAYDKWPELRLYAHEPKTIELTVHTQDGQAIPRTFIQVAVTAYRSLEDSMPAVATAWEPFPGRTPYTRDSEMMNAETSAIGRVLGLMGIGIRRSIASANEVRARQTDTDDHGDASPRPAPARKPVGSAVRPAAAQDGTRPATEGQKTLIGAMSTERGLELDVPADLTFDGAREIIDDLKKTPKVK